jgi:RNA polymerase sigma-70 factor (ECF subfamily)
MMPTSVEPGTIADAPVDRDRELADALRRRDLLAPERLVATFGDRAHRLAIGITGNRQDAEEAVQDAFWSVVQKIDTFRGQASLGSWIYRITANAAYQKRRRGAHRRDGLSLDQIFPRSDEDGSRADARGDWPSRIDDPAVQIELRGVLASALEELPAHYRAAIVLHEVEGLSMAETADRLQVSVATAKIRAHRGRSLLRKRLGVSMPAATSAVEAASA